MFVERGARGFLPNQLVAIKGILFQRAALDARAIYDIS